MRILKIAFLFLALMGNALFAQKETQPLLGEWKSTTVERNGLVIPFDRATFIFADKEVTIRGVTGRDAENKSTYFVASKDGGKTHYVEIANMDGRPMWGSFQVEGKRLSLALKAKSPNSQPPGLDTPPATGVTLMRLVATK